MPRVLGVDLPGDKVLYVSLSYLYGLGRRNSIDLCRNAGVDPLRRAADVSDEIGRAHV